MHGSQVGKAGEGQTTPGAGKMATETRKLLPITGKRQRYNSTVKTALCNENPDTKNKLKNEKYYYTYNEHEQRK